MKRTEIAALFRQTPPDGTPVERVDTGVSLEDSVPPEEVDRLLRGRYPRKVQVQYLRSRPEKSTCRYL